MTPRVLFVDHVGVLGGAELSLLDVARHHAGRCTVALLADGPFRARLEAAGVRVVVLAVGAATRGLRRESARPSVAAVSGLLGVARAVARLARGHDVIYANSQKAFVVAAAAGVLARRPVVWHLHDILNAEHFSRANVRAVVTLANSAAARVLVNSNATADAFVASGGHASKVQVVYNGIDAALFDDLPHADTTAAGRALGIGDVPVVGVFGRLSPWKGQHVLIEALTELPGVHAVVVGDALFGEEAYATQLRERAAALGVADRVHFLGFRADVPALMRLVDVVVHTSVSAEPFGRVIVEGMLAGRPVVATRAGGALEIVQDGVNGLLVAPGDSSALAQAVRTLLGTAAGVAIAAAGRADARARFSIGTMLEQVSQGIRDALPRERGTPVTPRVLFVDHVGVLGGAELSLLDIARHHAGRCTVALLADGPFRARLEAAGVRVVVLAVGAAMRGLRRESARPSVAAVSGLLGVARTVARLARGHDVIYANSQKAFVVAAAAGVLARRPVVWHLRDILNAEHFSRTNVRAVVALANLTAARVVANSHATASAFVSRGGRADKVRVVHNGIDASAFCAVTCTDVAQLRAEFHLGTAPVVGVFGRLSPWKGQHVLVDGLLQLPGVHALFVGDALFGEDDYAEELQARAAALGVADRVHFLGFRADVPALMRLVDVVVHTSVSAEPFGRVIVEGMLAGRPVVATRAGGALEIVQDGRTGVLVAPGDADALARAVAGVLRTDAGARMAVEGRADARERFSIATMLDGVTQQILEVVRR